MQFSRNVGRAATSSESKLRNTVPDAVRDAGSRGARNLRATFMRGLFCVDPGGDTAGVRYGAPAPRGEPVEDVRERGEETEEEREWGEEEREGEGGVVDMEGECEGLCEGLLVGLCVVKECACPAGGNASCPRCTGRLWLRMIGGSEEEEEERGEEGEKVAELHSALGSGAVCGCSVA